MRRRGEGRRIGTSHRPWEAGYQGGRNRMIEFTDVPTEQTTAVTDLLLAAVAFAGAVYLVLLREADPWKALVWAFAFTALGVGAFLGAVVHGVVFSTANRDRFWMVIHLSLGLCIAL